MQKKASGALRLDTLRALLAARPPAMLAARAGSRPANTSATASPSPRAARRRVAPRAAAHEPKVEPVAEPTAEGDDAPSQRRQAREDARNALKSSSEYVWRMSADKIDALVERSAPAASEEKPVRRAAAHLGRPARLSALAEPAPISGLYLPFLDAVWPATTGNAAYPKTLKYGPRARDRSAPWLPLQRGHRRCARNAPCHPLAGSAVDCPPDCVQGRRARSPVLRAQPLRGCLEGGTWTWGVTRLARRLCA